MDKSGEGASKPNAASIGATVVAMVVSLVVLAIVAMAVGAFATLINYYMSSMRIEAAGFFGAILGGIAGTYAARASCDAILRAYHKRAVFVLFAIMVAGGFYYELVVMPLEWRALTPVAQLVAIAVTAWMLFWSGEEI